MVFWAAERHPKNHRGAPAGILLLTWHELPKPTNELHFRADLVIVQPDGSTSVKHMDESWAKLLVFQLFYK